jgi:hypothetical protein
VGLSLLSSIRVVASYGPFVTTIEDLTTGGTEEHRGNAGHNTHGRVLLALPTLPSIGSGPDFVAGGGEFAMLGVGKLDPYDVGL